MKVLLLAPFDLFPPVHGGSSIVYNFIKHAAARHEVSAVISHLYSRGGAMDLVGENIHIRYCPPSAFDRLRVLSFFVNPYYYRTAEAALRESRPDVIQCEILWPILAGWRLRRQYGVPLVWVEHNIEALKFADLGRGGPIAALMRRAERFACEHADHIVALSDVDQQRLMDLYAVPPARVSVIQPGPDLADFHFDEESRAAVRMRYGLCEEDALLTFVGNLQYEPNQEALRRIAECIYPAVIGKHPSARFVVIGQGAEGTADCQRAGITFTGYLSRSDLVAHLCATDVFLVPVETGSGIRVKIPEATACGRAVVATRKAAEGLRCFADDEIVRVEAVDERFVAAVLRLIEDPALRNELGRRAQLRTVREFGWDKTLAAYEDVYARAIPTRGC